MADIPADIMALATELLDGAYQFPDGTYAAGAYEAIAKAILAERERCAAIARREKNNTMSLMSMPPQPQR
ncbi:hypothetical protein ACS5UA_13655 [Brucella sp. RRSP16]|uniref:hypothetical protein n=1 Tax=unclassified Brucella TaxID=2632610 RepID=UPI0018ABF5EF|nr:MULTISPECIES: hypothetical protein [unclassified Ochrobactrum]